MNIDDIVTPINAEYRINSIVALVIDMACSRDDSQITTPICAKRIIQIVPGLSAKKYKKSRELARKYATRPVMVSAAAI